MSLEQDKQHAFDAYCKRIVKNEAISVHRENKHRSRQEVTFSELTEGELQQLQYIDQYALERQVFPLLGSEVEILDGDLARALATLPPEHRDIVLLAYLLNMTDKGIAQLLKLTRSTVQYRRTSTLEQLKTIMEGFENE